MPPTPTTTDMGHRHEADVAEALGMAMTRGSGNGADKGDAAHHHDLPFAFRIDAKSTKGKQIAVTLAMLAKLREQAGGERPALPLRWYANEALTKVAEDWIAVTLADFSELIADARDWAALVHRLALAWPAESPPITGDQVAALVLEWRDRMNKAERSDAGGELARLQEEVKSLRAANASLTAYNQQAGEIIGLQRREVETPLAPSGSGAQALATPGFVPHLPWTIVHSVHSGGTVKNAGLHYAEDGIQTTFAVSTVVVERSLGSSNRPKLMVNGTQVREGALYVDGIVRVVASRQNRDIEMG